MAKEVKTAEGAAVEAVCISEKKGMVKKAQKRIDLKEAWGIEGDAHAGDWHRQVSLLAGESIDQVKEILPKLQEGAFAENIIQISKQFNVEAQIVGYCMKASEKSVTIQSEFGEFVY